MEETVRTKQPGYIHKEKGPAKVLKFSRFYEGYRSGIISNHQLLEQAIACTTFLFGAACDRGSRIAKGPDVDINYFFPLRLLLNVVAYPISRTSGKVRRLCDHHHMDDLGSARDPLLEELGRGRNDVTKRAFPSELEIMS